VHDRATAQRTAIQPVGEGTAAGLRNMISSNEGTGAQRMDESRAPSALRSKPWLGVRGGPHPGAAHQRDCGAEDAQSCTRARTIRLLKIAVWKIQKTEGATSALAREPMQRYSQLRSVTGVAVSVAPPACIVQLCFALSRLMEQIHWPPTLEGGRARRGRHWLLAIRLGSARACLWLGLHSRVARCSIWTLGDP